MPLKQARIKSVTFQRDDSAPHGAFLMHGADQEVEPMDWVWVSSWCEDLCVTWAAISQIWDFSSSLKCNPHRLWRVCIQVRLTVSLFLHHQFFSGVIVFLCRNRGLYFNRDPALSVFWPALPPLVGVLFNNNSWTIFVHFRCPDSRGHGGEFWGHKWTPSSFTASAAECINIFKLAKERVLQLCD